MDLSYLCRSHDPSWCVCVVRLCTTKVYSACYMPTCCVACVVCLCTCGICWEGGGVSGDLMVVSVDGLVRRGITGNL